MTHPPERVTFHTPSFFLSFSFFHESVFSVDARVLLVSTQHVSFHSDLFLPLSLSLCLTVSLLREPVSQSRQKKEGKPTCMSSVSLVKKKKKRHPIIQKSSTHHASFSSRNKSFFLSHSL
ncbi:hypothetical protein CSUI_009899 [Cystoisospora suis]|uniref:Uncharacterized protein n=1 Tax=Cystoisospora suis TaxID=483139 RepID=A0A2C6KIU9_9APIC|nr:hypothetical protein CSUI_009899 [Cystoisospora suis]